LPHYFCVENKDAFGGIGSAIIALKLNGIAMKKIIHVEHDMVATHVHRWNHDPTYNSALLPDKCEHIYDYATFEDIRDNVAEFLEEHGRTLFIVYRRNCIV
jgi:hypothetical protein